MTSAMHGRVIALCLLACVTGATGPAWANGGKIAIAVLPCTDAVMTVKKFSPLAAYLQEETGLKMALVVPRSHAELERAVRREEIDFAIQDPHTYIALAGLFDPDSLLSALTRKGTDTRRAVVIARKDSGIRTLEDLRGRRVMFGDELSAPKWMAAKALFRQHGVGIYRDLERYSHGGCCEDIAFSVLLKAVDAGVVCDHFLADHPEKQKDLGVDAGALFVVARADPVPSRVFAARRGLAGGLADGVARALLRLDRKSPAHAKILDRAEIGGFRKATDTDYAGIRAMTALP
jgi:phosphonate transport system substrate-binding protein